jgi:hypothetical protein
LTNPSEQWPYHAVAAVVRGIRCSFPEVNAKETAVTGISWEATDVHRGRRRPSLSAAVPVYGCGFRMRTVPPDRPPGCRPRIASVGRAVGSSRYLPAVSMLILFVNGTNDFAYPG